MNLDNYFDLHPDPACVLSPDNAIIAVNQAFCRWTNRPADGLLGLSLELVFQNKDNLYVPFGSITLGTLELDLCQNNQRLLSFKVPPVMSEEHKMISLVARYTTNAVVITNPEGAIIWVNEAFTKLTHYTLVECKGKKPGHLLQGPLTSPETRSRISKMLRLNKPFTETILNYRKDRTTYWVELQISPVFDENQKLIHYVSVETDITEKVKAEATLRETAQELNHANEELRQLTEELSASFESLSMLKAESDRIVARQQAIFNCVGVALIIFSRSGKIKSLNATALEWLGYQAHELIGRKPPFPFLVEQEVLATVEAISAATGKTFNSIEEYLQEPIALEILKNLEWTYLPKSGPPISVRVSFSPIISPDGEQIGYITAAQDITKRKLIEQELKEKNKRLTDSINYAQRIQFATMPSEREAGFFFMDFFVFTKAKDVISGDFYWHSYCGGKVFIAAVDCTGHGVPGALLSMLGTVFLTDIVDRLGIHSPEFILYELNNMISRAFRQSSQGSAIADGMDVAICVVDMESRVVEFAGAARPLLVVMDGEAHTYRSSPYSIGGQDFGKEKLFEKLTLHPTENAMFYLFSDGYQSQFGGEQGRKFGFERFKKLCQQIASLPGREQKAILSKTFADWQGKEKQTDDVLVLGFRV